MGDPAPPLAASGAQADKSIALPSLEQFYTLEGGRPRPGPRIEVESPRRVHAML
jgi:hypothetical protein